MNTETTDSADRTWRVGQIAVANRLRRCLLGVLGGLDSAHEPSAQKLIELIEVMTTMTRSLTTQAGPGWRPGAAVEWQTAEA
jgi:hypothetical protein